MQDIVIEFTPSYCYMSRILPNEVDAALNEVMAYQSEGYFFSPAFQNNKWDGYTRRFYKNQKHCKFRSGFIYKAIDVIRTLGYNPVVKNFPTQLSFQQRADTYQLRPYQLTAVQKIHEFRFGILQSPMRSGKTIMFIACMDSMRIYPAIFLCFNVTIAQQTAKKLEMFLPDVNVGVVADGEVDIQDVTILTVQSVFAAFKKTYKTKAGEKKERNISTEGKVAIRNLIDTAKVVFYDEVHHGGSGTSRFVLDNCKNTEVKIGLSATPFNDKAESILVEESVGPVFHKIAYKELIEEGFIMRPHIYLYQLPEVLDARINTTFPAMYKAVAQEDPFLNLLVKTMVKKINSKNHSVVIHTKSVAHTKELAKFLDCEFLVGNDGTEKRRRVISALDNKELLCVVSTLLGEGVDIPSLNYTINLKGGKSSIDTYQSMRSITAEKGKTVTGTIDFIFKNKFLSAHSAYRKRLYTAEEEFKIIKRDLRKYTLQDLL